jgi:hypothetical protein
MMKKLKKDGHLDKLDVTISTISMTFFLSIFKRDGVPTKSGSHPSSHYLINNTVPEVAPYPVLSVPIKLPFQRVPSLNTPLAFQI